jgi:hypothetical protein
MDERRTCFERLVRRLDLLGGRLRQSGIIALARHSAASIAVAMVAALNRIAWKSLIGWPNWMRCFA